MNVAVLMSTYNGEKFVEEQIESILNQNDCDLTLFIRDDGSTDYTKDILKKYESRINVRCTFGNNVGVKNSFLGLLKSVDGYDFYAFADQDDIWDENKIASAISAISELTIPACYYCNSVLVNKNNVELGLLTYKDSIGQLYNKSDLLSNLCLNKAMGCTMVINKQLHSVFKQGVIPEKCTMHDTYIKTLCAALSGVIIYDDTPHMRYRQHGNNTVGVKFGLFSKIKQKLDFFISPKNDSVADNAKRVLSIYKDFIPTENLHYLKKVSCYKDILANRISLSFFSRFKDIGIKDNIMLRLAILFGNR